MKYLLPCPHCGSKIPVAAGQAGQRLRCTCGHDIEAPSIRGLRELESVTEEEEIRTPAWSARQGVAFLGVAITIIAIVAAGAIVLLRPNTTDRQLLEIPINQDAIRREVQELSPGEAYLRLAPVVSSIPGYTEALAQGAVPPHLMPDIKLLATFEGTGPQPLTPKSTADLAKLAGEKNTELAGRIFRRRSLNDELWLVGVAAIIGILLASSSRILPAAKPRRAVAAQRR
ncbi:MAG TPA: hypothetical protein VMJ32_10530 [Pirellulales bacterium]|nr:hypothetical protein [Pirellulales bacterium]